MTSLGASMAPCDSSSSARSIVIGPSRSPSNDALIVSGMYGRCGRTLLAGCHSSLAPTTSTSSSQVSSGPSYVWSHHHRRHRRFACSTWRDPHRQLPRRRLRRPDPLLQPFAQPLCPSRLPNTSLQRRRSSLEQRAGPGRCRRYRGFVLRRLHSTDFVVDALGHSTFFFVRRHASH